MLQMDVLKYLQVLFHFEKFISSLAGYFMVQSFTEISFGLFKPFTDKTLPELFDFPSLIGLNFGTVMKNRKK